MKTYEIVAVVATGPEIGCMLGYQCRAATEKAAIAQARRRAKARYECKIKIRTVEDVTDATA